MKRRQSKKEVQRKSKELIYRKCRDGNFLREKVTDEKAKKEMREGGIDSKTEEDEE